MNLVKSLLGSSKAFILAALYLLIYNLHLLFTCQFIMDVFSFSCCCFIYLLTCICIKSFIYFVFLFFFKFELLSLRPQGGLCSLDP